MGSPTSVPNPTGGSGGLSGVFGGTTQPPAPPIVTATVTVTPAPAAKFTYPPEAFMTPAPGADGNTAYWNGYTLGKANAGLLPSPKGMTDFWAYVAACAAFEKPRASNGFVGFPIAGNDGYDDALRDARNYRWRNDPDSPDFVH